MFFVVCVPVWFVCVMCGMCMWCMCGVYVSVYVSVSLSLCVTELQHAQGTGLGVHDVLQHAVQPQHQAPGHLH